MTTDNTDIDAALTENQTDTITTETEPLEEEEQAVVGGLSENIAGALAYFFAPFIALALYFLEDDNEFVRFHAAQSIVVFGGFFAAAIGVFVMGFVLELLPFVGWMLSLGLSLVTFLVLMPLGFVLWVLLTYKAFKGERYGLPVAGDIAERYV
jgi:uncharacterized membrane protein